MNNDIHVLSDTCIIHKSKRKVAIVINLYYRDTAEEYIDYIDRIPDIFDVYLFTSNDELLIWLEKRFGAQYHVRVKKKENRGRDVSALLVAFKPYIDRYTYLCFLLDKKEKQVYLKRDMKLWNDNLWGNMLFSEPYIWNVIHLLEEENYGILMPPAPVGEYIDSMYGDVWNRDYENVVDLAEKLNINFEIDRENLEMVSISTVFWCRVDAMRKLFKYGWEYTSFCDEPMPNDGTISHAIERIFGFVAADAGYKVGTILNDKYASNVLGDLQKKLRSTYLWMTLNVGIKNTYELQCLEEEKRSVDVLYEKHRDIFLYGAGHYGELYIKRLQLWGYKPFGFIVSNGKKIQETFCDYPVFELDELKEIPLKDYGVIITANLEYQKQMEENLAKIGTKNYIKAVFT